MELNEMPRRNPVRLVGVIVIIGLLVGAGIGLVVFRGDPTSPTDATTTTNVDTGSVAEVGVAVGNRAPDFTLLDAASGAQVSLSDFQGQPVLINFWATWCGPCRIEMPFLEAAYQQHRDQGFTVLAVDFDEPLAAVTAFGEELGLSFNLLIDPGGEVQNLFRIRAYPSSYFIGTDGTIASVHLGVMTAGQVAENLELILQ